MQIPPRLLMFYSFSGFCKSLIACCGHPPHIVCCFSQQNNALQCCHQTCARCSLRMRLGTTLVGYLQGTQVLHPNHKTVGSFEPDASLLLASVAFSLWKLSRVLLLGLSIPPTSLKVRAGVIFAIFIWELLDLIIHRSAPSFIIDIGRLFANHPTTHDDS